MVVDGWIILQVARRSDLHAAGDKGAAAIAGTTPLSSVDVKLAQNQAKRGALIMLTHILEFDIEKLLYHYNRFLSYSMG